MDDINGVFQVRRDGDGVYADSTLSASRGVEFTLAVLEISRPKVEWLWAHIDQFYMAWDDRFVGSQRAFTAMLMSPLNVFYEVIQGTAPVGLLSLDGVRPGFDANAHALFWDRSFRGREDFVHAWLRSMFKEFQLHRIGALVPETNRPLWKFFRRAGMHIEGNLRKAGLHQSRLVDLVALSALAEEM